MELFDLTGFLIHRTDMKLTNFFIRKLKPYSVTPEQWGIISVLDGDRALTQKEIAEAIDRDQSTVVRMIASLEKKDMVKRVQNNDDRRSHNLFLSAKGMQLKTSLLPVVREAHEVLTRNLSQAELALLHDTLHKLYLNVKED
ncbi:MarR family winged helix-turn-helix transcriptional regulator [Paenibacillus sacheonensis]|uniref:MarR family transcriptional regulator n=1 Tax=Paenibacillus sacheonensis TaxID=742054 RepID=A0A7X4YVT7_9BACL|nr:MarR family transcriptional regulator [Paenibacillus sacheonensis]NBC73378.1 MarR family transcriptional regulator [Paenibacillus sacheonensis]